MKNNTDLLRVERAERDVDATIHVVDDFQTKTMNDVIEACALHH